MLHPGELPPPLGSALILALRYSQISGRIQSSGSWDNSFVPLERCLEGSISDHCQAAVSVVSKPAKDRLDLFNFAICHLEHVTRQTLTPELDLKQDRIKAVGRFL